VSLPMNPLAQVQHVKSQLSAAGEYVPTSREFERILRDVGCSKSVARRIIAALREDDFGGTPEPEPDVARALASFADQITAGVIELRFGNN